MSSEAAEAISLTPVVVQEMPVRELTEYVLGVAGKDEARIREIFRRGTLVSGASRFRWAGWEPEPEDLRELLAAFPDPDPGRAFDPEHCVRAILRGGRFPIEIPREAAARKSRLQRGGFWELLMEVTGAAAPAYSGYSYRDRADRFLREFTAPELDRLRSAAETVRYSTLAGQIRSVGFIEAELFVLR